MLFGKRTQIVKRILIVEDEPLTAFDNENILRDAGYEIVATVATRTAIDLVAFSDDGTGSRRLTRVPGAAFAPEPAADGSIFFLATGSDGTPVAAAAGACQASGPATGAYTAERAAAMAETLLSRGLVPRTFGAGHPLADHLRLTVRDPQENDRLIAAASESAQTPDAAPGTGR